MKYLFRLLMFLIAPLTLLGQNTTVTGTVTDPDGFAWVGGSIQFTLHNDAGGTVRQGGVPLTADQMNKTVPLDNTGSFSVALATNSTLTPIGTQWTLLVCPAASAPCQTYANFTALGASMSLTTTISSQIQALRFPAGYTARGYGDVEISPLPPAGGTYFNLPTSLPKFWNGTAWTAYGSGGGGGGTPASPANSIQLANAALTGFASDPNFLIDPATHILNSTTGNLLISALSSLPRATYDPMDTNRSGGLAAAIAGTSGFTIDQVLQATVDYGECQKLMGLTVYPGVRIPLPAGIRMNLGQVKLWSSTDFGGAIGADPPAFQHTDSSKPMITMQSAGTTITCSNSVTYNPVPGGVGGVWIHDIALAGMGPVNATNDIGILLNSAGSAAQNIVSAFSSNAFGGPAIQSVGTSNFLSKIGYPGGQIQGCASYNSGTVSIGTGTCGSVMDSSLDGGAENIYASDGQAFASGHAAGPCYPKCAAFVASGSGTYDNNIFAQVSGIGILIFGQSIKMDTVRVDYTSREAIRLETLSGGDLINNIVVDSSCTDTALLTNWNSGLPTGCGVIFNNTASGGNEIYGIQVKNNAGIFANSYNQCWFNDPHNGFNGVSNTYALFGNFQGNPNNTGPNSWLACGTFGSDQLAGRIIFPSQSPQQVTGSTGNATGITSIVLNGQVLNTMIGGIGGQHLSITGPGTVHHGGGAGTNNLTNSNGQDVVLNGGQTIEYIQNNTLNNNTWRMTSGPPNQTPTHINFPGNPTVTNPSMLDFFGTSQARANFAAEFDFSNLHGATTAGNACFEIASVWPDTSYAVSSLHCTNINIATMSPGFIPTGFPPSASLLNLYLVSNTQGNGIPIGKFAQPGLLGGGPAVFWNYTVIAAGGDGSTAPPAGENNTGEYWAPNGVLLNTYLSVQPVCSATFRGLMWLVDGTGSNPDVYQGCIQTGAAYQWINLAFGSTGTLGFIPLFTTPSTLGNSHINETANAGFETFTQGIIINDTSGNGGNAIGTEGTPPPAAVSVDTLWADSTNHQWMVNNNNTGAAAIATVPTAITSGHCVQAGANDTLTDAGAACGSGGGVTPGTPTILADTGAGTAPTVSLNAGASDFSGFFNITFGTCTGGVCQVPTVGVLDIKNSKFSTGGYSPQLKCFIEPANLLAMGLANNQQLFTSIGQQTGLKFTVISGSVGITQSTGPYNYYYHCDYQ